MTDIAKELIYLDKARASIKSHEGYSRVVYLDSVGVPTGGWGHAFLLNSGLPKEIWEQIFEYDFSNSKDSAYSIIQQRNLHDIGEVRKAVLIEMVFNLGLAGVLSFKNTLKYIESGDYEQAAANMLQSKWATQVGQRAHTLARRMRTGMF